HPQRNPLLICEISGKRSPYDGNVYLAVRERAHHPGWRIRFGIVAIYTVSANVLYDSPVCESVRGRSIGIVVPYDLHTYDPLAQYRVIQGRGHRSVAVAHDEHVAGPVVRTRGHGQLHAGRHAHENVARLRAQRVAYVAATLCPPGVLHPSVEFTRHHVCKLILEPFLGLVGVGQIVGVSADPQYATSW